MSVITPTIGRVVHYYPGPDDPTPGDDGPLAALVTAVWTDTCVNLAIFNRNGSPEPNPPTSITLVQPGVDPPLNERYCCWMPYQVKKSYGSESGEKSAGTEEIGGEGSCQPHKPEEAAEATEGPQRSVPEGIASETPGDQAQFPAPGGALVTGSYPNPRRAACF